MTELVRTAVFVGVATISVALAAFLAPSQNFQHKDVQFTPDEEFYPEFKDPQSPTKMRVVVFDEKRADAREFSVEFKDGVWRIPSHDDYPADATDRLARTAVSVIGIKRGELRSRSINDFEDLGVVDPLDQDVAKLKGRGQRITLSKGNTVLADLIVGKKVPKRDGFYFVRKFGENNTFASKLQLDLSAKFADWVETDLLKLDRDEIKDIIQENYRIDTRIMQVVDREENQLSREKSSDPWKLKDLKDDTEELDSTKVGDLVGTLDDLRLIGVRRKPAGLSQALKGSGDGIRITPQMMHDLSDKGFLLTPQGEFVATDGQTTVLTSKGIVYMMRYGQVFTGDEIAIEGGKKSDDKKGGKEKPKPADDKASSQDEKPDNTVSGRYLFVTAHFSPNLLGPKPVEPEKPAELGGAAAGSNTKSANEKPATDRKDGNEKDGDKKEAGKKEEESTPQKSSAGEKSAKKVEDCGGGDSDQEQTSPKDTPAETKKDADPAKTDAPKAEPKADAPKADAPKADAPKADAPKADAPKADAPKADQPAEPTPQVPAKTKADLQKEYDLALAKYKSDLKAYEAKVTEGKELERSLNLRFADWYYVIPAESFNKLKVSRKELVKAKSKPEADNPPEGTKKPSLEDLLNPKPPEPKPANTKQPEVKKPEPEKPDEKKPDEKKPDEKKPDEKKPDEKKPDEKKPDEKKPDEKKPDEKKPDEKKPDEKTDKSPTNN